MDDLRCPHCHAPFPTDLLFGDAERMCPTCEQEVAFPDLFGELWQAWPPSEPSRDEDGRQLTLLPEPASPVQHDADLGGRAEVPDVGAIDQLAAALDDLDDGPTGEVVTDTVALVLHQLGVHPPAKEAPKSELEAALAEAKAVIARLERSLRDE